MAGFRNTTKIWIGILLLVVTTFTVSEYRHHQQLKRLEATRALFQSSSKLLHQTSWDLRALNRKLEESSKLLSVERNLRSQIENLQMANEAMANQAKEAGDKNVREIKTTAKPALVEIEEFQLSRDIAVPSSDPAVSISKALREKLQKFVKSEQAVLQRHRLRVLISTQEMEAQPDIGVADPFGFGGGQANSDAVYHFPYESYLNNSSTRFYPRFYLKPEVDNVYDLPTLPMGPFGDTTSSRFTIRLKENESNEIFGHFEIGRTEGQGWEDDHKHATLETNTLFPPGEFIHLGASSFEKTVLTESSPDRDREVTIDDQMLWMVRVTVLEE